MSFCMLTNLFLIFDGCCFVTKFVLQHGLPVMAYFRGTVSVVLTLGAGFAGYRYIYQSKHREPIEIYDGITISQPWPVRLCFRFT